MVPEKEVPFHRTSLFYEAPPHKEAVAMIGEERWFYLTAGLLQLMFEEPSLSVTREVFLSMLRELWNEPEIARSQSYDDCEILLTIAYLQNWGTHYGLLHSSEIAKIKEGQGIEIQAPKDKYLSKVRLYQLAEKWKAENKTVGLIHGSFDPPHIGHANLFAATWPSCDVLLVGFDPNWVVKQRKGEDRPRFPQLAWRMWEVAHLPVVDGVFVLPVSEFNEETFMKLYRDLNIRVLGTSEDNPLLDKYQRRMDEVGGQVVIPHEARWSSTELIQVLQDTSLTRRELWNLNTCRRSALLGENQALAAGFLQDYPDGTNNQPPTTPRVIPL